jgi:hypothetical protein
MEVLVCGRRDRTRGFLAKGSPLYPAPTFTQSTRIGLRRCCLQIIDPRKLANLGGSIVSERTSYDLRPAMSA